MILYFSIILYNELTWIYFNYKRRFAKTELLLLYSLSTAYGTISTTFMYKRPLKRAMRCIAYRLYRRIGYGAWSKFSADALT